MSDNIFNKRVMNRMLNKRDFEGFLEILKSSNFTKEELKKAS